MNLTKSELSLAITKLGYEVPKGLKKDQLKDIYLSLKKKGETIYSMPEEIEYHPFNPRSFTYDNPRAKKYLEKNGFVVYQIPNFDPTYIDRFKEFVQDHWDPKTQKDCPFDFEDPKTWKSSNLPILLNGIFKHGAAHMDWFWDLREQCIPIFSQVYGTDDLLSSFDGLNLSFKKREPSHSWIHCDCPREMRDYLCYQGVVNFLPNGDDDGGLLIVKSSHQIYDNYLEAHPTSGYGWYTIQMGDPLLASLPIYKINLQPGEICLWNSKTFHCNMQPLSDNLRMAAYVSMIPRSTATSEDLEKRIKAFEEGKGTGHWQCGPAFKTLPTISRYGGYRPRKIEKPKLNNIQKRLVGYGS